MRVRSVVFALRAWFPPKGSSMVLPPWGGLNRMVFVLRGWGGHLGTLLIAHPTVVLRTCADRSSAATRPPPGQRGRRAARAGHAAAARVTRAPPEHGAAAGSRRHARILLLRPHLGKRFILGKNVLLNNCSRCFGASRGEMSARVQFNPESI